MSTATVLRTIRENREKQLRNEKLLPSQMLTKEQFKQLLVVDPPFKLDIVSLMNMWGEKRLKVTEKTNTPISEVMNKWIQAGKDPEEKKNRRNGIQSLINHGIVQTNFDNGQEMSLLYFRERNGRALISDLILKTPHLMEQTKKTYQVMYGSLWRYLARFIYGPSQRHAKKLKPLKRGIRPLELPEAAAIFDIMEKKAMKSSIGMRDLLIMRLILYSGEHVEIKSIFALRREDINFVDRVINIKTRHTKKIKKVECSQEFIKLLKSHLGRRKEYVFIRNQTEKIQQDHINKRLLRIVQEANVSNITLKSIQRSYIYILKSNGIV